MERIRYLTADDVVLANRAAVGQEEATINFAMLELAIQLPQQEFGDQARMDLHMKAGILMYALIRKPAFSIGNKRTAVLSVHLFYAMNGMWLEAEQDDIFSLPLDIEAGLIEPHEAAAQLKQWVTEIP